MGTANLTQSFPRDGSLNDMMSSLYEKCDHRIYQVRVGRGIYKFDLLNLTMTACSWSARISQWLCRGRVNAVSCQAEWSSFSGSFQDSTGLYGTEQQGISPALSTANHIRELGFPRWKLPSPVMQVNAPSSKWARFLLSPGNNPRVDGKPSSPLQEGTRLADPAQVEQGTVETKTLGGHFNRAPATVKPPQTIHTTIPQLDRPDRKTPEQPKAMGTPQADGRPLAQGTQKAAPLQLHNLFTSGEDFDDDL